jgi:hypothetical protein
MLKLLEVGTLLFLFHERQSSLEMPSAASIPDLQRLSEVMTSISAAFNAVKVTCEQVMDRMAFESHIQCPVSNQKTYSFMLSHRVYTELRGAWHRDS